MACDLKMTLKIVKFILTFIAMILLYVGTGLNMGGDNDADAEKEGERMKNFAWNQLQLDGDVGGQSIKDAGLFIGFHQACAYGCANGECGGQCATWAEDDNYDTFEDFCDDGDLREASENGFNYAIEIAGGGKDKADGFADKLCACWSMQFAIPAFLIVAATLLIIDLTLTGVRFCTESKCLHVASAIIMTISALLTTSCICAYGVACNLNDQPEAMLAWGATLNSNVAGLVPAVAAGTLDIEGAWGSGFWMTMVGTIFTDIAMILGFFTGSCAGSCCTDCCPSSSSTSNSASSNSKPQEKPQDEAVKV